LGETIDLYDAAFRDSTRASNIELFHDSRNAGRATRRDQPGSEKRPRMSRSLSSLCERNCARRGAHIRATRWLIRATAAPI